MLLSPMLNVSADVSTKKKMNLSFVENLVGLCVYLTDAQWLYGCAMTLLCNYGCTTQVPLMTYFCKVMLQIKCYISSITRPMAIELGNVVNYYKGLLRIKWHNPRNTKSHEVKWQIKHTIYYHEASRNYMW